MEAYPNPRWRDSNHHSNRLPPNYSSYHHHPPSPNKDFPHPQPIDHRHWQRNGPLGPSPWVHGANPWPATPPTHRPPLLPGSSNNMYMRMHRKEREFAPGERHGSPNWLDSPDRRRDFPFHSPGFIRRPDGFQHDYNGPIRSPRYQNRTAPPRDHHVMSRNYDHSYHHFNDNSPLSRSPVYSEPMSSPGSRTWDSPLSDRGPSKEDLSPRDPRCKSRHSSSDEFLRRRGPHHPYDFVPSTSPNQDPHHLKHSRSYFENNRLSRNGFSRSSLHTTTTTNSSSSPPANNLNEPILTESNHKSVSEEFIKETSPKFDKCQSLEAACQSMNEHTNSPLSTETNLSRSSFLSEEDISDSDLILQIDEFKIETSDLESSIDVVDDCCSDDSYVSLTGFDLDLDTDPDILSPPTQSPEISPLIVSIPLLIFSQLFGDKSTAGDVDKQQCQNDTHIFECSPVSGKSTNTKRLSRTKRRLHRSPSKDEDSCSTASSSSRASVKKPFQDFVPEILETRSRAEAATVRRREKMEKEIENNEKEREATAIPSEQQNERFSPTLQDDSSSTLSVSSYQDGILKEEFSPEFINRIKRTYYARSTGSGDSILHRVCRSGRLKVARYFILVEQHKVDVQDNAGWTPLHEACNKRFSDIASVLLENGADPNLPSFDGSRPIHDAIEAGSLSIVKLLVEYGADYMAEQGEKTPLELARTLNMLEITEYLEEVINDRKKKKVKKKDQTLLSPVSEKKMMLSSSESILQSPITLPFDGYKEPMFGPELDSPVIYLSSIIERSQIPFLPLYNIKVSHGINPRKHNFHLLSDILQLLSISCEALLAQINVKTYTLTVGDFLQQLLSNPLTRHSSIIEKLHDVDIESKIELVPLCNSLRRLLGIEVANIDDY